MLALDMRDAFGSVSHVQLRTNLSKLGLHPMLTGLILDSYSNAQVKVVTLNGATNPILIKRSVKQVCSLSPLFFDICVDPLTKKLSSIEFKLLGYWWSEGDGVTAQAYAGDILLFANWYEHMLKRVEEEQDFIRQSNIQLNPRKREILKIEKDIHTTFPLLDESKNEIIQLDCVDDKKVIRYLGASLGKGKISKIKK
jgi:hypothetical protein